MAAAGTTGDSVDSTKRVEGRKRGSSPILQGFLDFPQWQADRSFAECPGISGVNLESLQNAAFPVASPRAPEYRLGRITEGFLP
jgi:hypothetical protein